jgi:hypothetical protein
VFAYIDQGLNDVIKGVDVIIEEYDLIEILFFLIHQEGFLQPFFGTHTQWL